MVTRSVPEKCSKNFINCRRHPARSNMNVERKFKNDFKAEYIDRKEKFYDGQNALAPTETDSAAKIRSKKKQLRELEKEFIISKPDSSFRGITNWSDGKEISGRERIELIKKREALKDAIKLNIEKEEYYGRGNKLNPFQEAMSQLIIQEGLFTTNTPSWGDSRGYPDYGARAHFESCGVEKIDEYEENATWSTYDSFHTDDKVGVRAVMSCKCGSHYKSEVYLDPDDMGSFMSRLMTM